MSWAKLDDQFHAHRKAKKAWRGHPRALGLHLLAISYCAGHLTDGFVDDEFVEEKLPAPRERAAVTSALEDAGLWAREGEGWRINDWLDFNPSRDEVLDRRRRDAERKKRKESERTPRGVQTESAATPNDPSRARAFPDPTRPDPTPFPPSPPRGNRTRDREKWKEDAVSYAEAAGVTGRPESVLRAVEQAARYHRFVNLEQFRAFARQNFPSLNVVADLPDERSAA